jgi:CheY-like chemotaxis protein
LVDVPFIFCSGRDGALDRILGLRMGADDYLVKPIVPEEVVLKVRLQITKVQYLRALKAALENKDSHSVMRGNFGGISVLDVLQTARMLGQGEYAVRFTTEEDSGAVYLNNGRVLHAETGWFSGSKAFSRLLQWEKGNFDIEHRHFDDEPTMSGGLEELMLDHLTQIDEARVLRDDLEAKGNHFTLEIGAGELNEKEISVCSLLENSSTLPKIFDNSPYSDKETTELLLQLIEKNAVKVTRR